MVIFIFVCFRVYKSCLISINFALQLNIRKWISVLRLTLGLLQWRQCKLTRFELWLYEGTDIKYYVCSLSKYRRASWLIEEVLLLTPCSMRSIETARRNASSIIASVHVAEIPPSWSGHYVTLGDSYKSYQSLKEISQYSSPTHLLDRTWDIYSQWCKNFNRTPLWRSDVYRCFYDTKPSYLYSFDWPSKGCSVLF